VVGCLIEKQLTTPQQYPLTLNALVSACNQSSNRDPVVDYDDHVVESALASLRSAGFIRFLHPSHGRSVIRFAHALDERLGLDERALSLLSVLLLRGAQTAGELRVRTERTASFEAIGDVESELGRLSAREEPLAVRLGRRPGQKEERWAQTLAGQAGPAAENLDTIVDARPPASARSFPDGESGYLPPAARGERVVSLGELADSLGAEVAALRTEVAVLRSQVEQIYRQLGEPLPAEHEP
jgi:uncharacterized protein YceH (UPF0502 family)